MELCCRAQAVLVSVLPAPPTLTLLLLLLPSAPRPPTLLERVEGVPGPLAVGEGYGAPGGGPPPLAGPGGGAALWALLHHRVELDVRRVRAFG